MFIQGQLSNERSTGTQASTLTGKLKTCLTALHHKLEYSRERKEKATVNNRQLNERIFVKKKKNKLMES